MIYSESLDNKVSDMELVKIKYIGFCNFTPIFIFFRIPGCCGLPVAKKKKPFVRRL
jgi:hypothetical protein